MFCRLHFHLFKLRDKLCYFSTALSRFFLREKNSFAEVLKYLPKYKSENNCVKPSK